MRIQILVLSIVKNLVLLSSQENVNLIHEILRQAFYLNLQDSTVIQCLEMYKKWFLRETSLPYFINDQKKTSDY